MQDARHRPRTSKTDSLMRLERSALLQFSKKGYDGTSLRDIADAAGLQLSLIDRHFGSKAELFQEIHTRVWRALNAERAEILTRLKGAKGCAFSLEDIILAFVSPVVSLALESPEGTASVRLVREARTLMFHRDLEHSSERNAIRQMWIDALMATRPTLSACDAVWAFALVVKATYSNQLLDNWLNHMMPNGPEATVDEITRKIVTFCTGGVDALAGTIISKAQQH